MTIASHAVFFHYRRFAEANMPKLGVCQTQTLRENGLSK